MKNYKKSFIENMKDLMKERKISQTALASVLSVDQTTVSAWLRGESEPTLTKICALMDLFGITFEEIIE